MFVKTPSGILRPRTPEEKSRLTEELLHAPLIAADYVASISQLLSPRRREELAGLARVLKAIVEPHAASSDVAAFPHIAQGLRIELGYASMLLAVTDEAEQRLVHHANFTTLLPFTEADLSTAPSTAFTYCLRVATTAYFAAAWGFLGYLPPENKKTPPAMVPPLYHDCNRMLTLVQSMKRVVREIANNGLDVVVDRIAADPSYKKSEVRETLMMLMSNQYQALLQDVVFGEMRAHALTGNYRGVMRSAKTLDRYLSDPACAPSPVIAASAELVKQEAIDRRRWHRLRCEPFVADSPPIALEAARHIIDDYRKSSSLLWTPGKPMPGSALL